MTAYLPSLFEELFHLNNSSRSCCNDSNSNCKGLSIAEDEEKFYIHVPIPGLKSDEVEVSIDPQQRRLIINGESKQVEENIRYHLKNSQKYHYELPLSKDVDLEASTDATAKDGMLKISLFKNKKNTPKKIDVKVE